MSALLLVLLGLLPLLAAAVILAVSPAARSFLRLDPVVGTAASPGRTVGRIRVLSGRLSGMEVPVAAAIVLGRDPLCAQLVFPDDEDISRAHCEIGFDETAGTFQVKDLASRNGTYAVDTGGARQRLPANQMHLLPPGGELLLGAASVRLALEIG